MINKKSILATILMVLYGLTSYAQVRIEVVPPFIEGGGSPSWNENRNTPNSVSEDVFELKNGSIIRGNLESFSGGVYFVNIGGITKSIPENSILKINGQFLSSVKATVPDKMTAEIKVVKLDYNSLGLLFDKLQRDYNNPNKVILKNNKLQLDNDDYIGYYKIKGNNEYVIRKMNGTWFCTSGGAQNIIEKDSNSVFGNFYLPLKVDSNGVYCLAWDAKKDKSTNVYYYRYGANNLDGPVAKCDNSCGRFGLYSAVINDIGLTTLAVCSWTIGPHSVDSNKSITFYKSTQINNGLFSLKPKYTYECKKKSENENTNEYIYTNNGFRFPKIGYGHILNKSSNNWIVVYHNIRKHKVTQKKDSELYIDIFEEDVTKGVVKSLNLICPSISFDSNGYEAFCMDIDRDGINELVFRGDSYDKSTENAAIIVKLK